MRVLFNCAVATLRSRRLYYFIFILMLCTRKFFIQKLYEWKVFFFFDNFVAWNWFNKSIVNIIRTTIMIVLRLLNNCFLFVIFAFYNIFFLFFLQFEQKSNICLTIIYLLSHKQCAIKTSKTRFSCKDLLNSILFILK